jgi:hypothetical protein
MPIALNDQNHLHVRRSNYFYYFHIALFHWPEYRTCIPHIFRSSRYSCTNCSSRFYLISIQFYFGGFVLWFLSFLYVFLRLCKR